MKQKIYPLLYTVAIFLSGLFYIFLCDLAYFDRIAKNGGIWLNSCSYLTGNSQQVCMAHYDVLCILVVLGLLMWLGYILVPVYKNKTFFYPFAWNACFFGISIDIMFNAKNSMLITL